MSSPRCSEEEFIHLYQTLGPQKTAEKLGIADRNVHKRRSNIEKRTGQTILPPASHIRGQAQRHYALIEHPHQLNLSIENGVVLVGSDAHYWPGEPTTAHKALIHFCKKFRKELVAVIMNGDSQDNARISRFPPNGWEQPPTVGDELDVTKERHEEIRQASKNARHIWNMGNHCIRFDTYLANRAPEMRNVFGTRLEDHFPHWEIYKQTFINDDVIIKHKYKGGEYAPHNNTKTAGVTAITSHNHHLGVMPYSDIRGTRFGTDTGMLAEPYTPQFNYTDMNSVNWRSGFIKLTWRNWRLMWPEIIHVFKPGWVEFQDKEICVE